MTEGTGIVEQKPDMIVDPEDHIRQATMTIQEARVHKDPRLFIINTSDLENTTQRGEVSLKLANDFGAMERFKIPDTWIPVDVTQYQEKTKWIKDTGFNKLVNQGYLTIVKPDVADAVLAMPDTKYEEKRLRENDMRLRQKGQDISAQVQNSLSRDKYLAVAKVQEDNQNSSNKSSVAKTNPRIATIMQNSNTDEAQKLAALKSSRSIIGNADISFIIANCNKDNPRIKQWALSLKNNM